MTAYQRQVLRPLWLDTLDRNLDPTNGIPAVIRNHPALSKWEQIRSVPSGRAEDQLTYAITIAAVRYDDHPFVAICLARAAEIHAAGRHDQPWGTWWSTARSVEHGKFVSAGCLAAAWSKDSEPERDELLAAAAEILIGATRERPVWSEAAQGEYIQGIQELIIVGELQLAAEKLRMPKGFDEIPRHYAWHTALLDLLLAPSSRSEELTNHFDGYFDLVRSPRFASGSFRATDTLFSLDLIRLRLALIRWIYIERKPIAGNWRHIIGQIGY
jgi:hypothetical protein